jgi:glyceraldehyde 3-phosphate dehydrogenase
VDEVKKAFRSAATRTPLKGIIDVLEGEWASARIIGDSHSSIIDLPLVQVMEGTFVSVAAWYDNEMGFSTRLAETAARLAG